MIFDKITGLGIPPIFFILTLPLFILLIFILWKQPLDLDESLGNDEGKA